MTVKVTDEYDVGRRLMGDMPVTPEIAARLTELFGVSKGFWLRLEANYRKELELEPYSKSAIKAISPWETALELAEDRGMSGEGLKFSIETEE